LRKEQILRARMPELDSLRGVAILSVVLYHGLFWSNNLTGLSGLARMVVNVTRFGWLGVNLFFVLSGFLITGILLGQKNAEGYYSQFYFRRVVRILPALYALLLILYFVPGQSHKYLLLSFFFCANLATLFHIPYTYPVLWSLGVEEHFYLLWPWAVRRVATRFLYLLIAVLLFLAPVFRALAFARPLPEGFGSYTWQSWDGIAAGALLALLVREPWMTRRLLIWVSCSSVAVSGLGLAAGAPFGILTRMEPLGATFMLSLISLVFFGFLGMAVWCGSGVRAALVQWRILSFYGEISYGLYLYHLLVFRGFDRAQAIFWPQAHASLGIAGWLFGRTAVVLAAATGLSYISRWFYEERFLKLKRRAVKPAG
jgi:peptidoglycan/LPS O-acetylase OafA/YrhL